MAHGENEFDIPALEEIRARLRGKALAKVSLANMSLARVCELLL